MDLIVNLYDRIYKRIGSTIYYRYPQWRHMMPDKMYLQCIWRDTMGYEIDFRHPKTFCEKLQWLKLYNRKPIYTKMVDKATAKEYAASIIGEEYIIPTLGTYNIFDEIDFDKLPNQFVLKSTHDSGGVYICKDKSKLDKEKARSMTEGRFWVNVYNNFREWPYKNVKPRIIAEKYVADDMLDDLRDYKFFCFDGQPVFCQVISDRSSNMTIDFFDKDWKHQEFHEPKIYPFSQVEIKKPENYELMMELSAKLSLKHPFLRVDFYESKGKVYFGELTFFPTTGMGGFEPAKWDKVLGDLIKLPTDK